MAPQNHHFSNSYCGWCPENMVLLGTGDHPSGFLPGMQEKIWLKLNLSWQFYWTSPASPSFISRISNKLWSKQGIVNFIVTKLCHTRRKCRGEWWVTSHIASVQYNGSINIDTMMVGLRSSASATNSSWNQCLYREGRFLILHFLGQDRYECYALR